MQACAEESAEEEEDKEAGGYVCLRASLTNLLRRKLFLITSVAHITLPGNKLHCAFMVYDVRSSNVEKLLLSDEMLPGILKQSNISTSSFRETK